MSPATDQERADAAGAVVAAIKRHFRRTVTVDRLLMLFAANRIFLAACLRGDPDRRLAAAALKGLQEIPLL